MELHKHKQLTHLHTSNRTSSWRRNCTITGPGLQETVIAALDQEMNRYHQHNIKHPLNSTFTLQHAGQNRQNNSSWWNIQSTSTIWRMLIIQTDPMMPAVYTDNVLCHEKDPDDPLHYYMSLVTKIENTTRFLPFLKQLLHSSWGNSVLDGC